VGAGSIGDRRSAAVIVGESMPLTRPNSGDHVAWALVSFHGMEGVRSSNLLSSTEF
jgi:hypothetical protein